MEATPRHGDLPRRISALGAAAIMVGIMVGSGIFRTPTSIANELGSPWLIVLLWAAGGVLSLFGALTYAELSTMHPRSGGIYVYLYEGLGPAVAFVFGWTYMLITKPAAAGAIATVFAEHLNRLLGTQINERLLVCIVLILLTAVNTVHVQFGAGLATLLTALKIAALAGIVVLGIALGKGSAENLQAVAAPKPFWAALMPVMAAVLWTYDGWSDVASIAGEVKHPQRSLPTVFLLGTAAVTLLYSAVNVVYLWMMPLTQMRGEPTVAPLVMERLLGSAGSTAVTVVIVVSTIGATHGSIITGARVTFAQAQDGLLFGFLGRVHPRYQTPAVSLWFQCLMSCIGLWVFQTFEALTNGFVFTMWIFYALAAVSVMVLRVRRPDLARPYRTWGYPAVPLVFIAVSVFMTALTIVGDPKHTLPWLGVLLAGVPLYYAWRRWRGERREETGER